MKLQLNNPNEIYSFISKEISKITNMLNEKSDDDELNQMKDDAYNKLLNYEEKAKNQLDELEKNAEWNTFTVAFYGETGAGKSTLIETLRIILKEPSKVKSQIFFRELLLKHSDINKDLSDLRAELELSKSQTDALGLELKELSKTHEAELAAVQLELEQELGSTNENLLQQKKQIQELEVIYDEANKEVEHLFRLLVETQLKASFLEKFIGLFKSSPGHKKLKLAKNKLEKIAKERQQKLEIFETDSPQSSLKQQALNERKRSLESQYKEKEMLLRIQQTESDKRQESLVQQIKELSSQLEPLLEQVKQNSDGAIIGEGLSDFTKFTQRYDFTIDNHKFALLDVPGIEGKEGSVLSQIESAVQTAHAVFYVSNNAAPPQTGDDVNQGTIGRIKKHLGAQTEVWAIYNKKITNIKHGLIGQDLISAGEKKGLDALTQRMTEQLGPQFCGVRSLTAGPAFLVSSECFAPESRHNRARAKILNEADANEVLEKSAVPGFISWFKEQLLDRSEEKIRKANFNKVGELLKEVNDGIENAELTFTSLSKKFVKDRNSAQSKLDASLKNLKSRIETDGNDSITTFVEEIRKKAFTKIEEDIGNDEFKKAMEKIANSEIKTFSKNIEKAVEVNIKTLEKDINDIVKRFQKHVKEFSNVCSNQFNFDIFTFNFDFLSKLDNGINWGGLVASIGGMVVASLATGGVYAVVAILLGAVGVLKAFWGFFSSSYKKGQQRKVVNESLAKVQRALSESLSENLEDAFEEIKKELKIIKQQLQQPEKQVLTLKKSFSLFGKNLNLLIKQIKAECPDDREKIDSSLKRVSLPQFIFSSFSDKLRRN